MISRTYAHARGVFAHLLATCASAFIFVACTGVEDPSSPSFTEPDSTATDSFVEFCARASDKVALTVSPTMAKHYEQTRHRPLDSRAGEELVAERIHALEGKNPAFVKGVSTMISVVDLSAIQPDMSGDHAATSDPRDAGCVTYVGVVSFAYYDCPCSVTEYYDAFYNQCNDQYIYSYLYETWNCKPHMCACP